MKKRFKGLSFKYKCNCYNRVKFISQASIGPIKKGLTCVAQLSQPNKIAIGSFEPFILILSPDNDEFEQLISDSSGTTFILEESNRLFASSYKKISVYSINENGKYTPSFSISAHENWIRALAYLSKTNQLVSCGSDQLIKVWNDPLSNPTMMRQINAHLATVQSLLIIKPSEEKLVSGGNDSKLQVFSTNNNFSKKGQIALKYTWLTSICQYKENLVICNSWGGFLYVCDIDLLTVIKEIKLNMGPINCLTCVGDDDVFIGFKERKEILFNLFTAQTVLSIVFPEDKESCQVVFSKSLKTLFVPTNSALLYKVIFK